MTYTLSHGNAASASAVTIRVHLPTITTIAGDRVIVQALEEAREVQVLCTGLLPLGGLRVPVPCAARNVKARFSRKEAMLTLEVSE